MIVKKNKDMIKKILKEMVKKFINNKHMFTNFYFHSFAIIKCDSVAFARMLASRKCKSFFYIMGNDNITKLAKVLRNGNTLYCQPLFHTYAYELVIKHKIKELVMHFEMHHEPARTWEK